ncbi:hypothetical protein LIER_32087 [Lithospermum erythrorhizon]|uniref:Uncharacterized protein n=1 Tax=Lithospermum erythrorhizon TaxID=34254 RepID=A0AAV3RV28_LITER
MKERETIADMHQRFNVIRNNLQSLGKEFTREEINEPIGSLKAEEELITRRMNKKPLAIVVAKAEKLLEMNETEEDGDDELVMLAKNFKRLLKNKSNKGEYPQRSRKDSDSEVEEIANAICLMANDFMEVTLKSESSSKYSSYNDPECECKNYNMTYTELNEANGRRIDDYAKFMDK